MEGSTSEPIGRAPPQSADSFVRRRVPRPRRHPHHLPQRCGTRRARGARADLPGLRPPAGPPGSAAPLPPPPCPGNAATSSGPATATRPPTSPNNQDRQRRRCAKSRRDSLGCDNGAPGNVEAGAESSFLVVEQFAAPLRESASELVQRRAGDAVLGEAVGIELRGEPRQPLVMVPGWADRRVWVQPVVSTGSLGKLWMSLPVSS